MTVFLSKILVLKGQVYLSYLPLMSICLDRLARFFQLHYQAFTTEAELIPCSELGCSRKKVNQ